MFALVLDQSLKGGEQKISIRTDSHILCIQHSYLDNDRFESSFVQFRAKS